MLHTANELIGPITGKWVEVLIRDIFYLINVGRVLRIPLSKKNLNEDLVAWYNTRLYAFSVRSAYSIEWGHT